MSARSRRVLFWTSLAVIAAVVLFLPLVLMLPPNPKPIAVAALSQGGLGTFIGREPALFKVFPQAAMNGSVPPDMPHVTPDAHVYVKDKTLNAPETYTITSLSTQRDVPVTRTVVSATQLEIAPTSALAAGTYVATVPKSDMYGSTDYFYFVVDPR